MKFIPLFIAFLLSPFLFAQTVVQKTIHTCDSKVHVDYYNHNQLLSKRFEEDTLYLHLGLVRNCHFASHIDLSLHADSLILAITNTSDIFAACECYLELELKITGLNDTNFTVYFNHAYYDKTLTLVTEIRELKKYPSRYIFPTPEELHISTATNQLSPDDQRIGYWHIGNEKTDILALYELNEAECSVVLWHVLFDPAGTIIEICTTVEKDNKRYSVCIDYPDYLLLDF